MKHAKGKWIVKGGTSIESEDGFCIADTNIHAYAVYENKANAKLISKAPEMYEALKILSAGKWRLTDEPVNLRVPAQVMKDILSLLKEIEGQ